jgi:16S rRNA (cytosine967-C5)-methyltransferase
LDPGRKAAFAALSALEHGASWDEALRRAVALAPGTSRDGRFARELASGTVRWRGKLDWVLGRFLDRPLDKLEPDVRVLLRLGLYQILETDKVPDWSAVHETVEQVKEVNRRAAGFANAVLRAVLRGRDGITFPDREREPLAYLVAAHSHPEWMLLRWLERFGLEETEALCAYDNRRPELCLRVNRIRSTREELLERLPGAVAGRWSEDAVRCSGPAYGPARQLVQEGLASVQDESGMLVAPLLEPRAGLRLLDLAAAPGGKACHLGELLGGGGVVAAFDRTARKLERLRENVLRLGLENVLVAEADARELRTEPADGVLLDAPCSGLGVLSRRPDSRWRKRLEDLPRLQALQLELLAVAARHVRPGGVLVYSVCSFEPEETSDVVEKFGAGHHGMRLDSGPAPSALRTAPGILYFLPQRHGLDGGFAARWRRHS